MHPRAELDEVEPGVPGVQRVVGPFDRGHVVVPGELALMLLDPRPEPMRSKAFEEPDDVRVQSPLAVDVRRPTETPTDDLPVDHDAGNVRARMRRAPAAGRAVTTALDVGEAPDVGQHLREARAVLRRRDVDDGGVHPRTV